MWELAARVCVMLVCDLTEYICMSWDIIYMTIEDIYMRSNV